MFFCQIFGAAVLAVLGLLSGVAHAQANKAWIPLQPFGQAKEPAAVSPYLGKGGVLQNGNLESTDGRPRNEDAFQQQLRNLILRKNATSPSKTSGIAPTELPNLSASVHYFTQGQRYWNGEFGYPKNEKLAVDMLRLAMDANYPPALYQLGRLYMTGSGVLQDEALGTELQNRARLLGLAEYDAVQINTDAVYRANVQRQPSGEL
ncbi:MAG: hypothetical protein RIR18_1289 [Pseudomonadota bacterium]